MRTLSFGTQLRRLSGARGLDVTSLVDPTVLSGAPPSPSLLRRLAPTLALHRSDLFLIAGQAVPDDLARLDARASGPIAQLSWSLTYLPRAVPELRRLIDSLPQQPRPSGPVPPVRPYPNTAGGLLLRLLENRNLNWSGAARYLFGVGDGPMLSASTIGLIGRGAKTVTPQLLAGFAAFLDIAPRDLSALTGIALPDGTAAAHPDAAEAAALLWSARRLTAVQLRDVVEAAHAMRHERADELQPFLRCTCPGLPRP